MTINKKIENETLILNLEGRLDTGSAPALENALIPAFVQVKKIILDFSELSYVSSAGLRVLLMGQKTAKEKDVPMTLVKVPEEILEIFEIAGFCDMLTIE